MRFRFLSWNKEIFYSQPTRLLPIPNTPTGLIQALQHLLKSLVTRFQPLDYASTFFLFQEFFESLNVGLFCTKTRRFENEKVNWTRLEGCLLSDKIRLETIRNKGTISFRTEKKTQNGRNKGEREREKEKKKLGKAETSQTERFQPLVAHRENWRALIATPSNFLSILSLSLFLSYSYSLSPVVRLYTVLLVISSYRCTERKWRHSVPSCSSLALTLCAPKTDRSSDQQRMQWRHWHRRFQKKPSKEKRIRKKPK